MSTRHPPLFCPYEDHPHQLHPADVRVELGGARAYLLPPCLPGNPSAVELTRIEALVQETLAHVRTLQVQAWMHQVALTWAQEMGDRMQALGVQALWGGSDGKSADDAWLHFRLPGASGHTNERGYWITRGTEAALTDLDRSNLKTLRDLLTDMPKDSFSLHLMDIAFREQPNQFTELSLDDWKARIPHVVPEAIAPVVREQLLGTTLPAAPPGRGPRL